MRNKLVKVALRTSLLYVFIAGLWILLSDRLLMLLVTDPVILAEISMFKGWCFVIITALLLYVTLRGQFHEIEKVGAARKQAEEAMKRERHLLRTLIDLLPDFIYVKDTESRFLVVNETLAKYFGKPPAEVLGCTDADFFKANEAAQFRATDEEVCAGTPLINHEARILFPNGQTRTVLTTKIPFRDERGQICGLVGLGIDITQRKSSEGALQKSEEHLRNAAWVGGVGTLEHDLLTDEIYFSPLLRKFYDFKPDEKITIAGIIQRIYVEDQQPVAAAIRQAHDPKGDGRFAVEQRVALPNQPLRWLRALTQTFFEGEGDRRRPVRTIGAVVDITERKQAEEALLKSNRALHMLSDCNQCLIRATNEKELLQDICKLIVEEGEYVLTWVGYAENDEARTVRPVALAGVQSDRAEKFKVSWGDNEYGRGPTGRAIRSGKPCIVQDITSDASLVPWAEHVNQIGQAAVCSLPLTVKGKIIGALVVCSSEPHAFDDEEMTLLTELGGDVAFGIGILRDHAALTRTEMERQKLEGQLRQSQKMEAIGQLAGGVAHDFNNLLTVIQGNASMLLTVDLPPNEMSDCAWQIVRAAERAAGLTRQLLLFSRKQVIQPENRDLNEIITQMTRMLQRILGEDITLQSIYSPNLPAIYADSGMIEQVILNLAVNSRDAMPTGGQMTIATGLEIVDEQSAQSNPEARPGNYVWLTISDTGHGIAPENLQHIFEPFFTTKEVGKGTGLGLATVYGVVKQHGGWITVTSELNRGTTFRVYFPAVMGDEAKQKNEPVVSNLPRGTETILVVEDESPVRLLVTKVLQRCGYTVLQAHSGTDAMAVWHEQKDKINLVLTDIIMPDGLSGHDLVELLQAEKPQLKVIYTSGYSGQAVGKNRTLSEGHNFLRKPYQPAELARLVRKHLDD